MPILASPVPQTAGPLKKFNRNALRLAAASSQRLTKTFSAVPTDLKKQTFSFFLTRPSNPSSQENLLSQFTAGSAYGGLQLDTSGRWIFQQDNDGATLKAAFRTAAGLFPLGVKTHLHILFDSTQAVAADRLKVSVDGGLLAGGDFDYINYPSLNYQAEWLLTQSFHEIGALSGGSYWSGDIDEVSALDGAAVPAASFVGSGVKPLDISALAFGNNGFWQRYEDDTQIGLDSSGSGNNFTPVNLTSADIVPAFA